MSYKGVLQHLLFAATGYSKGCAKLPVGEISPHSLPISKTSETYRKTLFKKVCNWVLQVVLDKHNEIFLNLFLIEHRPIIHCTWLSLYYFSDESRCDPVRCTPCRSGQWFAISYEKKPASLGLTYHEEKSSQTRYAPLLFFPSFQMCLLWGFVF